MDPVVDISKEHRYEIVCLVEKVHENLVKIPKYSSTMFVQCDINKLGVSMIYCMCVWNFIILV
jgi:hypothetical protein